MTTLITPEVRAELLDHMTRACILWTEDLMKGYFADPKDSVAQQLILEAYAAALITVAQNQPNKLAIFKTFILELQDFIDKETP